MLRTARLSLTSLPLLLGIACASDQPDPFLPLETAGASESSTGEPPTTVSATANPTDPGDGTTTSAVTTDNSTTQGTEPGEDTTTADPTGGTGETAGACTVGAGNQQGGGSTTDQYFGANVTRDGKNYRMITNGWGANWQSHNISWQGTTLRISTFEGSRQMNGAPAGYPSVFCGRYSDTSLDCGLPRPLSSVTALNTAASWSHPDANGTYNVAYDVWLGNGSGGGFGGGLESYFMVWLRDPPVESPAGSLREQGVTVTNAPGTWNIIAGMVNGLPIVNYVRAEGDDVHSIAFDIMDFIRDAQGRGLTFPGNDLLAVAIGFEVWQGPVTNLSLDDFCLDIQ